MVEEDFLNPSRTGEDEASHESMLALRSLQVELYTNVYRYQIQIIQQYSRHRATRFLNDVCGSSAWKTSLSSIQDLETQIDKVTKYAGQRKLEEQMKLLEDTVKHHSEQQEAILKTLDVNSALESTEVSTC